MRVPRLVRRIGAGDASVDGALDRTSDGWRQGRQNDLPAFAVHAQDAVAVFVAKILDIRAAGFEDPEPEQTEHGDEGEVVGVGRRACGGEHGFELQMGQTQGG